MSHFNLSNDIHKLTLNDISFNIPIINLIKLYFIDFNEIFIYLQNFYCHNLIFNKKYGNFFPQMTI